MREYGFLFSIPGRAEGGGEERGGLVEGVAVDGGPEVEDVAVGGAVGLEALEDFCRSGPSRSPCFGARRSPREHGWDGAAALLCAALDPTRPLSFRL